MELFDFDNDDLPTENTALMAAMDSINKRFSKKVTIATGFDKSWQPKAERISQRYATDWRELMNFTYRSLRLILVAGHFPKLIYIYGRLISI
jgi:hypothetical protein